MTYCRSLHRFVSIVAAMLALSGLRVATPRRRADPEAGDTGPDEETSSALVAAIGAAISAGGNHSCVILEGGAVKCWGLNSSGQLGLGDTVNRGSAAGQMSNALPAVNLGKGLVAKALASGSKHTCVLLTNNQVKCWGGNNGGQLGQGDNVTRGDLPGEMGDDLPAVDLGTGRSAKAIAAGGDFTCAILDTNQVKCWGANTRGQLGLGDTAGRGDQPGAMGDALPTVNLGPGRSAISLALGDEFACALLDNKAVKCWGRNTSGQLGQGNAIPVGGTQDSMTNLQTINLGTGLTVKAIAARFLTACALIEGVNQIKCWGWNGSGNLGTGDTVPRGGGPNEMGDALPYVDVGGGTTVKDVTVGSNHVCALLDTSDPSSGTVTPNQLKCWGGNFSGTLGLGDNHTRGDAPNEMGDTLPLVSIGQGRSVRAFSAGSAHTCVVLNTSQVKCWGGGASGQLGLGDPNNRGDSADEIGDQLPIVQLGTRGVVTVAVGAGFACARLVSGQLKCWGLDSGGQLGLATGEGSPRGDGPGRDGRRPAAGGPRRQPHRLQRGRHHRSRTPPRLRHPRQSRGQVLGTQQQRKPWPGRWGHAGHRRGDHGRRPARHQSRDG